tara:strand:+ start:5753 stop:6121 length:369 start_codon:yes stop_codon:yes gene_type:complete
MASSMDEPISTTVPNSWLLNDRWYGLARSGICLRRCAIVANRLIHMPTILEKFQERYHDAVIAIHRNGKYLIRFKNPNETDPKTLGRAEWGCLVDDATGDIEASGPYNVMKKHSSLTPKDLM